MKNTSSRYHMAYIGVGQKQILLVSKKLFKVPVYKAMKLTRNKIS